MRLDARAGVTAGVGADAFVRSANPSEATESVLRLCSPKVSYRVAVLFAHLATPGRICPGLHFSPLRGAFLFPPL